MRVSTIPPTKYLWSRFYWNFHKNFFTKILLQRVKPKTRFMWVSTIFEHFTNLGISRTVNFQLLKSEIFSCRKPTFFVRVWDKNNITNFSSWINIHEEDIHSFHVFLKQSWLIFGISSQNSFLRKHDHEIFQPTRPFVGPLNITRTWKTTNTTNFFPSIRWNFDTEFLEPCTTDRIN